MNKPYRRKALNQDIKYQELLYRTMKAAAKDISKIKNAHLSEWRLNAFNGVMTDYVYIQRIKNKN